MLIQMADPTPLPRPPALPLGRPGPALRRAPVPVAALTVSAVLHGLGLIAVVVLVIWNGWPSRERVIVVEPMVAAVGMPSGQRVTSLPPRAVPLPSTARAEAPEPLPKEARQRETPQLPEPARAAPRQPPAPPALPRPGEKEPPPLSALPERRPLPAPPVARTGEPTEARPAPPTPAGQVTGSSTGTGALTLNATDFPHAWYLRQVLQKVEESWQRQAQQADPPERPLVSVEIQRTGSIGAPRIERTSGNAFYDRAAVRAIMEASPFPPLPTDWNRPELRLHFRFELRAQRG